MTSNIRNGNESAARKTKEERQKELEKKFKVFEIGFYAGRNSRPSSMTMEEQLAYWKKELFDVDALDRMVKEVAH